MPVFPQQIERLVMSLEQIRCLASRVRGEVFWAFTSSHAQSVAEVAAGLGKSAQTIHYHVGALLDADMLVEVGTRRSGARTERLYAHAASVTVDQAAAGSPEYHAECAKGFRLGLQTLVRETDQFYDRLSSDPNSYQYGFFLQDTVMLSARQVKDLKRRLQLALAEIAAQPHEAGGAQVRVVLYAKPTEKQHREWGDVERPA